MGEPIEQGTRQALGAEHGGPLVEWQIAGDMVGWASTAIFQPFKKRSRPLRMEVR